ncbi:MAG: dipeptidase [Planctomycetota bacterium]
MRASTSRFVSRALLGSTIALFLSASEVTAQEQGPVETWVQKQGVSRDLIDKARRIHDRLFTVDTHKDIRPTLALQTVPDDPDQARQFRLRNDPTVRGVNQVDFPKMLEGGYRSAFYIVYVTQRDNNPAGYRQAYTQANLMFSAIERMCENYPEHIAFARTPAEMRAAHERGLLVCTIGIENGYPMGTDLSRIEEFQRRGANYMSIAHNRHSQLGDSHTPVEPLHGGLSDLGRRAVGEMNRVGIMVDVSHASKATMMQAVDLSVVPVLASHSGCRAVCDHSRNLDDEQLLAMKRNRGVVQLVALDGYVRDQTERDKARSVLRREIGLPDRGRTLPDGTELDAETFSERLEQYEARRPEIDREFPRANVRDFGDHIDHAVEVMGIDHVGISSDFDGGGGIEGWDNAAETFNVTLEMVRRGYTEQEIQKIWAGNTLRVWAEVQAHARLSGYQF